MATLRNRPNPQLMLPRDENADAVGSKVGGGGLAGKGLQLQRAKSIDRPRKLLGDITNVKDVQPHSMSKSDTPKPGASKKVTSGSENVGKDVGKPPSSAKPARLPLRNITNDGSQLKGASPREPSTSGKQKPQVLPGQPDRVVSGLNLQQSIEMEDINAKIQRWAEQGIEKVHFSSEAIDSLRLKVQNEEMEKRVAKALAYRTDLPRIWYPPAESKELELVDVLELDHIPDRQFHSCDSSEDDQLMDLSAPYVSTDDLLARHLNWDTINLSVGKIEDVTVGCKQPPLLNLL